MLCSFFRESLEKNNAFFFCVCGGVLTVYITTNLSIDLFYITNKIHEISQSILFLYIWNIKENKKKLGGDTAHKRKVKTYFSTHERIYN